MNKKIIDIIADALDCFATFFAILSIIAAIVIATVMIIHKLH